VVGAKASKVFYSVCIHRLRDSWPMKKRVATVTRSRLANMKFEIAKGVAE